jgi:hypothetical protein
MGTDDFLQMALLKRQIHAYPSSWLPTDAWLAGGNKGQNCHPYIPFS